jgi:non-canonical poly(A) RNA polymerase PAPD5/7
VKLEDKESSLFVDISFNRGNGVAALSFIKKYLLIYPELKYMLVIVKAFLKARDLNETFHGGMSSFVCTILIISYLQETKKEYKNDSLLLSEHILNFFHLYGVRFDYNTLGVSIRNGGSYFLRETRDWLAINRNKPVTL